jgi:hypothetical protein
MMPGYALQSLASKRSIPPLNARNASLDAEVIACLNGKRSNHSRSSSSLVPPPRSIRCLFHLIVHSRTCLESLAADNRLFLSEQA